MAKTTKMVEVPIGKLVPYANNAKKHSEEQVNKIVASIEEFGFLSPCLIDQDYNIIAGHGRVMAAEQMGLSKVPCVFVEGLTEAQRRAYILADNRLTELGEWDMEIVNAELHALDDEDFVVELTGFELPEFRTDWFESRDRFDASRQEGNEEYNEFLDKFEQPKTTDDCYTPDNIYDIIAGYVEKKYNRDRKDFVRPFYPGGDYQNEKYAKGSVVVDNPPFSILAEIIDFYIEHEQPFFLFTPGLSNLGYLARESVTSIVAYAPITYENGARVPTSFVTNMGPEGVAALADPELYSAIEEANDINEKAMHKSFPKYDFPFEVLTSAKMGWLAKYGQTIEIKRSDSVFIRALDAMKESGKGIYGGALLLSERAAATCWELSDSEREIVQSLGR